MRAPLNPIVIIAVVAAVAVAVVVAVLFIPRSGTVKVVEMIGQTYKLHQSVDARDAPSGDATSVVRLHEGFDAKVIGVVEGRNWVQVELPDARLVYLPAASVPEIGNEHGSTAPAGPAKPGPAEPPGQTSPDEPQIDPFVTNDFQPSVEQFTVATATAAYVAPNEGAPQMYPVGVGVSIQATAKSKDGIWVVTKTANGQAAFLLVKDLGPFVAKPSDTVLPMPDDVTGPGKVIDTAAVAVGDQRLDLFGVTGETDDYATQMQSLIDAQGPALTCHRQELKYVCKLPNGLDIARMALYNGAARPGPDATPDYNQQANHAQEAKLGVWRQQ